MDRPFLFSDDTGLLCQTIERCLDLSLRIPQVNVRILLRCRRLLKSRLALLPVRSVPRLYITDELLHGHVAEVRVLVEHDKVLDHFVKGSLLAR